MRDLLGYLEVVSDESGSQVLLVSQQVIVDVQGDIVEASKVFTLHTIWGEELRPTPDPFTFVGRKGTQYRRVGLLNQGDPYVDMMRRFRSAG